MSPASRRASPRSWVAITTLMPARGDGANDVLDRFRRSGVETLAVGSSRNNTVGSRAKARARASRCCSPPESWRAGRDARSGSPTSASSSAIRASCSGFGMRAAAKA